MAEYNEASVGSLLEEYMHRRKCEESARLRHSMGESDSNIRRNRYERYHKFYAPLDGDQWPEDKEERPGKIHITANIIKPFIDVESRVLSILPRITNIPASKDKDSRMKGEVVEDLFKRNLELTDWDVWMADCNRTKGLYAITYLKPFWNDKEKRPDVQLIEQPQNLMLGYGSSDYKVVDWAIYKYGISPLEVNIKYPNLVITNPGEDRPLDVARPAGDHFDPLTQQVSSGAGTLSQSGNLPVPATRSVTEYEGKQVQVWDYWYRDESDTVQNAILIQGTLAEGPTAHPELPKIPYIPIEHDHEPGSPEGMSTVELLIPIQMGLNRVVSHFAQLVADNSGTGYQLVGENADSVPEGLVPAEDEIIAAGISNRIEPIQRGVNPYPLQQLIQEYWNMAHRITGLPEIMFGNVPGAQTSGRTMAIQIEAASNRIDPKRRRLYKGLRELLLFWGYMFKKINPEVTVNKSTPPPVDAQEEAPQIEEVKIKVGDFIEGFDRWNIIAPEITPRDSIENAQNVLNLVNGHLLSMVEGMDQIGVENPEQMMALIEAELSNATLHPAEVQAKMVALQIMQAIAASEAEQAAAAAQGAGPAEQAMNAAGQQASPSKMEDQNQPMTQAGMAPPAGAGAVGTLEPLVRQTSGGKSQALSQVKLKKTRV